MTATKPLSLSERAAGYLRQSGRLTLTDKQKKRALKKFNRADKRGQKGLLT